MPIILATSSILTDLMPKVMITRQTWSNIFSRCVVMLYTVSGCKCIQENLKNKKVLLFLSFVLLYGLVPPSAENGRRSDPAPISYAIPCIHTTYTYWTVVGAAGSTPRQPSAGREKPSAKGQQYSFSRLVRVRGAGKTPKNAAEKTTFAERKMTIPQRADTARREFPPFLDVQTVSRMPAAAGNEF